MAKRLNAASSKCCFEHSTAQGAAAAELQVAARRLVLLLIAFGSKQASGAAGERGGVERDGATQKHLIEFEILCVCVCNPVLP